SCDWRESAFQLFKDFWNQRFKRLLDVCDCNQLFNLLMLCLFWRYQFLKWWLTAFWLAWLLLGVIVWLVRKQLRETDQSGRQQGRRFQSIFMQSMTSHPVGNLSIT